MALLTFTAETGVRFPVFPYDIHEPSWGNVINLRLITLTIHMGHVAGNCLVLVSFKVPHYSSVHVVCVVHVCSRSTKKWCLSLIIVSLDEKSLDKKNKKISSALWFNIHFALWFDIHFAVDQLRCIYSPCTPLCIPFIFAACKLAVCLIFAGSRPISKAYMA